MSTVPTIRQESITGMTGLEVRPVFFLKLNNSPNPVLVVKGEHAAGVGLTESETTVSVKWGSKIMKNVNNKLVNTKIMTGPEISAFKAYATQTFDAGTRQRNNINQQYKWVKMPMVSGLSDAEYYSDANKILPGKIKTAIKNFLDDSVWMELGKVVAADVFNGNSDRFDISTGHWQNKGNVMFLTGGQTSVIGLDTYDPNALARGNLAGGGGYEELKILNDPMARKTFAQRCTESVGSELMRGLKSSDIGSFKIAVEGVAGGIAEIETTRVGTLFVPYTDLFEQGLTGGAAQLKQYLQAKVRQYAAASPPSKFPGKPPPLRPGMPATRATGRGTVIPNRAPPRPPGKTVPQGVLDRLDYLGWNV